ncbi:hypothetical protein IMCC1933_19880 [Rhodobacteraceae bacterium IMCC1933]|nr:hypothetical protein [Rhodobacteraceae bacterium IMCC1923]MDP4068434.1 hypothetical protein [Rhodobacteraceae bacterium IMCC1933]MDP4070427.1 hypothetical protein [Rhodobacteraceae bacterium IMCC1909]
MTKSAIAYQIDWGSSPKQGVGVTVNRTEPLQRC